MNLFVVSAFYGEHYDKKISVDGYIWSKSKFLGLSIGVHMIGQGTEIFCVKECIYMETETFTL